MIGRSSGDTPNPPEVTSRIFFDSAEASEAFCILQALRLSAVYKSIKVHYMRRNYQLLKFVSYLSIANELSTTLWL